MSIDYAEWFDRFWEYDRRNKYIKINNPATRYKNVRRALAGCHNIEDIEKYVCSLNSQKESTRQMMIRFFEYIRNHKGPNIDSEILRRPLIDGRLERRLEIAKFLHEPRRSEDIQDQFRISDRTCRDDLKALGDGIEAFGSTISLEIEEEGEYKRCRTTLHPVFLPLNLTEVYALTVYLPKVLEQYGVNRAIIMGVIDRVKAQLSDYAFLKLFNSKNPRNTENSFNSDEMMAMQREYVIDYLAKSRNSCRFIWKGNEYIGRIRHTHGGYTIFLEDGSILDADLNEVDFIINYK